jgi:hypothetical protein
VVLIFNVEVHFGSGREGIDATSDLGIARLRPSCVEDYEALAFPVQ